MAIIIVADVLKTAEDFETKLVDYYTKIAEGSVLDGVKLLTDYMGRHRHHLSEALERLGSAEREEMSSFPIRYEPLSPDCRVFERHDLPVDATAAEVLDIAIKVDECLIDLYRQVLKQDVDQEVKDLFESLVRTEERDAITLKKIKAMDYF